MKKQKKKRKKRNNIPGAKPVHADYSFCSSSFLTVRGAKSGERRVVKSFSNNVLKKQKNIKGKGSTHKRIGF